MRLVMIADTHGYHREVEIPPCDVLIHAGDFSMDASQYDSIVSFNNWLGKQPCEHALVIAGNHDTLFASRPELAYPLITNAKYLQDELVTINGVRFYGFPWTPKCGENFAFNAPKQIMDIVAEMIKPCDVLISHGPPFGILDTTGMQHQGSESLLEAVYAIEPKVHVFGHIHGKYGTYEDESTKFFNAALYSFKERKCINKPWVYDLEV
jgi:Icc-related predicted phosphoesterase